MNEYETNPQRHEASSPEEPSHRSAAASRDDTSPERGQSDTTAHLTPGQPYQAPTAPAGYPTSPWQGGEAPHGQAGQPGQTQHAGQPGYPGQQYPGQPYQAHQYPAQQYPGQSFPGQPAGHPGYPGQPGYPTPQQPYATGAQGPWTAAGVPPHDDSTQSQPMPAWAQHVGSDQQAGPARMGRGRKIFVAGTAAVLLALGAGSFGAYAALTFADVGAAPVTTKAGETSVNRVVDRSSLAEIASAVKNSVVSISTGSGEGSGVILTPDGYVLTNEHVVASAQSRSVKMVFADGKSATATIVGTDPRTDLAVIKADGVSGLAAAKFGKSADMQVGDTVLALGSPLGLEGSVTQGIISAKDRTIRAGNRDQQDPFGGQQQQQQGASSMSGLLQTDAPINPGNSGGALVNINAQVIGINSAIATSGQGSGNIGLGFAIPSDKAIQVADALMKGQKVSHPALGVSVVEGDGGGAVVGSVTANSAAAKAGLQKGDVVTQVNGKPINDSDDLIAVVQSGKVGDTVKVTFTRNGVEKTVDATLAEAS